MSYNTTFHWPAGPSDVIVTGTFDNWTQSLPLVKTSSGDFEITLPLKPSAGEDKVLFKFIVDGEWVTSSHYETENDSGNVNNVIYFSNLAAIQEKSSGSKIPEAGGLVAASKPSTQESEDKLSTTVMPSEEGKQVTSGEPGVVIPENAAEIKEFSEVSNVNAKDLNEKIKAEEAAEKAAASSSTNGISAPVVPSGEVKELSEVRDVDAKELNEKINAEEAAAKTKTIPVKKVIKRNKVTGEEIVVSSEPVDKSKTLDPKVNGDKTDEETAPPTATTESTAATDVSDAATPAPSTPVKKAAASTKTAKKAATPAKEEKKKSGFSRFFKKLTS